MSNLWLALRKYWFIPVVLLLVINAWVTFLLEMGSGNGYLLFKGISEMSTSTKLGNIAIKWTGLSKPDTALAQSDYFESYRNFLLHMNATSIKSIAIGDSVFAPFQPRYHFFKDKLLYSQDSPWKTFTLDNVKDSELHQLFRFFNSRWQHFAFWTQNYKETKDIYKRYREVMHKPSFQAVIHHATDPDSTVVVTYSATSMKDKLQVGGIAANQLPASNILFQYSSTGTAMWVGQILILIITLIFLWRAIWIMGKLGVLEFLFLITIYYPVNWFSGSLFGDSLVTVITQLVPWLTIGLIWQNPSPISQKKVWTWIFVLVACYIFINNGLGMITLLLYPLLLCLFIIQLIRQRGLRRRVMWRWFSLGFMPLGMFIALVMLFHFVLSYLVATFFKYWSLNPSCFFNRGIIYSLSFDYWLSNIMTGVLVLILATIPGGFILGMLQFPLRLYYRLRKSLSAMVTLGAYLMIIFIYTTLRGTLLTRNFFVLFFLGVVGILLSWLMMKLFRFIDPVHHDGRKAQRLLLENSFGQNKEHEYFDFYRSYLQKLYPRTRVGLAFCGCEMGLEHFLVPSTDQLAAIPEGEYFNLDLARIDRHPSAAAFPEWIPPKGKWGRKRKLETDDDAKLKEVRLYYPLFDSNGKVGGYLYLAESGKLYWDEENADFIADTVKVFNSFLNNIMLNSSYREEQVKLELEKQERILNEQLALERQQRNHELQEINQRIMDSINYASLIQRSILPKDDTIREYLKEYFIIWKPRDVVGGDYYWFYPLPEQNSFLLGVIDCTGHGVPGALMTLMTNSILNSIVRDRKVIKPDEIIRMLHREVRYTMQQKYSESMKDGLDISLVLVDRTQSVLSFAGAVQQALFFAHKADADKPVILSGGKFSLGGSRSEIIPELHSIPFQPGDQLYLVTDGLLDQPVLLDGVLKRQIFQHWLQRFLSLTKLELNQQQADWESLLDDMLLQSEQRDDITLLGIKL